MEYRHALQNMHDIYSSNQLNVILGTNHGAVIGRLSSFKETSYENKIFEISNKLNTNTDPRKILFDAWSDRFLMNVNALVCRNIREKYDISLELIGKNIWKNSKSGKNIASYESGTNLMPNTLFNQIFDCLCYLTNSSLKKEEKTTRRKAVKLKLPEQEQVLKFMKLNKKIPSITKLIYPSSNLKGYFEQIEVFNKLNCIFDNVFVGTKFLPCEFKEKRERDIDILVITEKDNIAIEVKGWKDIKWSTLNRRLKHANVKLRAIRKEFPEITRYACVIPNLNISLSWKEKFKRNGSLIIDKSIFENKRDMQKMLIAPIVIRRDSTDAIKREFETNKESMFYNDEITFLRNLRKSLNISLSEICNEIFDNLSDKKTIISGIETGKRKRSIFTNKYKEYLLSKKFDRNKILELVEMEKHRWKIAEEFPMIVGLISKLQENEFELRVENALNKNGSLIIRNALINTPSLSLMTLNGHHPEADIIIKNKGKYTIVSCKDNRTSNASQAVVAIKREIEQLSQWIEDIRFDNAIMAVYANFSEKTWNNLRIYAKENNIEFWRFDGNDTN